MVVHVLYGNQYLPAGPLLAILIWSEIGVFFAAVVINIMIAKNQQSLLPVPTLVGAAVNVALNLVLIPRYAATGAAWATVISHASLDGHSALLSTDSIGDLAGTTMRRPIVGVALLVTRML